jgi:hypothetical protein
MGWSGWSDNGVAGDWLIGGVAEVAGDGLIVRSYGSDGVAWRQGGVQTGRRGDRVTGPSIGFE